MQRGTLCVDPNKMSKRAPRTKKRARKGKRKFARKKRGNSKKRILEVASTKKRDTMRIATINGGTIAPVGMRGAASPIPADNFYSGIWCPTYRLFNSTITNESARNARTVYWKGLAERYRIETTTNLPVEFRRIVFSCPDRILLTSTAAATDQPPFMFESATNRYWRSLGTGPMNTDYLDGIFAGQRGIDWLNPMTAKTDTKRVKVLSDRRYKISSGNDAQTAKEFKFYDVFNKNMTYDDDEAGGLVATSGFAQYSNNGQMQNVYVLTLLYAITNQALTPTVDITSTVYWHER